MTAVSASTCLYQKISSCRQIQGTYEDERAEKRQPAARYVSYISSQQTSAQSQSEHLCFSRTSFLSSRVTPKNVHGQSTTNRRCQQSRRFFVVDAVGGVDPPEDGGNGSGSPSEDEDDGSRRKGNSAEAEAFRLRMERMMGNDDDKFRGKDLATLIRNKYGRSYDVQLIKKEFMGRQLLAMNVMWKYREQKSFPLTEEEYIYRLDEVADNLRCWGAVSSVRSTLEKTKERPRIGKAVSIFIDMDDSGGRANEWINR